jgi:hypothetical protein
MAEEITIKQTTDATPLDAANDRTGKPGEPVDMPPYHNAETWKIAEEREAELLLGSYSPLDKTALTADAAQVKKAADGEAE